MLSALSFPLFVCPPPTHQPTGGLTTQGPEAPIPQDDREYAVHDQDHALLRRKDGWFYCLSGIVTPPVETRWGQDRQSFVSIWHERTGLIVGGGNSKDQPEWSTIIVGTGSDAAYLPTAATLHTGTDADALILTCGGQTSTIEIRVVSDERLEVRLTGDSKGTSLGQLLLTPELGQTLRTGAGDTFTLGK